jgi:tetratricopeptide (TPR) repeat protein
MISDISILNLPSVGTFIGRHAEHISLHKLILENNVVIIEGLSGVGKTTMVSSFAHNKTSDYEAIIWHNFQEEDSINFIVEDSAEQFKKQGFEYLYKATQGNQQNAQSKVRLLIEQLKRAKTLFILDSFELLLDDSYKVRPEYQDVVFGLFKTSSKSKIVITTKIKPQLSPILLSHYSTFPLKGLSVKDTTDLLSQLSKKHNTSLDVGYSQQIYKVTEGNPLALTFLVASLIHRGISLQELLNDLENIVALEVAPYLLKSLYPKLTIEAQKQLKIASAFRKPFTVAELKSFSVKTDFVELRSYFFIESDLGNKFYSLHPIVREYAYKTLKSDEIELYQIHVNIGNFYFSQVKSSKQFKDARFISALLETIFHYRKSNYLDGQMAVGSFIARHLKQPLREFAKLGETNLSKKLYEVALKAVKGDSELHQFYARLLEDHYPNHLEETKTHYAESVRLTPDNPERQMNYLNFLAKTRKYEFAQGVFKNAILIPSCKSSDKIYVPYAKILLEAGKRLEAEKVLKLALQNVQKDSLSQVYVMHGFSLASQGKFEQAEQSFEDGVKKVPAQNGLEDVCIAFVKHLVERRKFDKAVAIINDAMTRLPPQKLARLYVEHAKLLRQVGNNKEAIEVLETGIKKVPSRFNLYSLYWEYCDLLKSRNDLTGALSLLKRGVNHVLPEHKGDALILEYVKISRKIGKYDEAEQVLKYGIEKTPVGEGLKILYIDYSNLLIWKNRHDEAILLLEKALLCLPKRSHSAIKRKMRELLEEKKNEPSKSNQHKDFGNQYFRKGEHIAPYLLLRKKLQTAKSNIVIIDPYINEEIIETISTLKKEVPILIISEKIKPSDFGLQINKLRKDGYSIKVFKSDFFHDRFLGVDDEWVHSGHSFKDIGSKSSMSSVVDKDRVRKIKEDIEMVTKNTLEFC